MEYLVKWKYYKDSYGWIKECDMEKGDLLERIKPMKCFWLTT